MINFEKDQTTDVEYRKYLISVKLLQREEESNIL